MLRVGTQVIETKPHQRISILADGQFTVYATLKEDRQHIYGPMQANVRKYNFITLEGFDGFEVSTDNVTCYTIHEAKPYDGREHPDPTPVEFTLEKPLTLREEMRRFVREEISRTAQESGAASFEEEDDFEVDYEEELPVAKYEFAEIQDDYQVHYTPEPDSSPAEQEEPASREPLPASTVNAGMEVDQTPPNETPPTT